VPRANDVSHTTSGQDVAQLFSYASKPTSGCFPCMLHGIAGADQRLFWCFLEMRFRWDTRSYCPLGDEPADYERFLEETFTSTPPPARAILHNVLDVYVFFPETRSRQLLRRQ